MKYTSIAGFSSIIILCTLLSNMAYSDVKKSCSKSKIQTSIGASANITDATYYENRRTKPNPFSTSKLLPPHCHVEGEIDRRQGADGKSYALKFAINLPSDWNGRYLFQGGGGLNGTLNEAQGDLVSGSQSALDRGFAVVSTDSGHEGQIFDASFMADQEAALNFFFLGNMRVTKTTKSIVEVFYSSAINKSYFVGCSTGGREGMIMSQRFPYLFDGIVSGAPAIRTGLSNLALRWLNVQLNQAAPKDEDGFPLPGGTFNDSERNLIVSELIKACDALDGIEDELIFNTNACKFDPLNIACKAEDNGKCLAKNKAIALKKAVAGPVDSRGVQLYSRFMYDTGFDDNLGFNKGLIAGGGVPPVGPPVAKMMSQDVDAEFIAATSGDSAIGDTMSFNLSSFVANGGKHLFYHGMADPWFSAMDTVNYFERLSDKSGGLKKTKEFSRLFLVPGMGHCAGGEKTLDQFDMLSEIVDWVENNKAPEKIIATGKSMPEVSRPLCPYPSYPHYKGSDNQNSPSSYECRI